MYLYILYIIGGCNSCCLQTRPTKVLQGWFEGEFEYVMHNFKVMKNDGQFRVCDYEYKLSVVNTGHLVFGKS